MSRVNIPVTSIVRTASTATPAEVVGDATNNHSYANADHVFLTVRNAHATLPKNLTVLIPATIDGQAVTSKVYAIPALATHDVGPFPVQFYGSTVLVNVESTDLKLIARRTVA
jgi:hypothetical protein